jgi:hypothetical protein
MKPAGGLALAGVGLDRPQAVHGLGGDAQQAFLGLQRAAGATTYALAELAQDQQQHRGHDDRRQRQLPLEDERRDERGQALEQVGDGLAGQGYEAALKLRRVPHDPGHKLRGAAGDHPAQRQVHDVVERFLPYLGHRPGGEVQAEVLVHEARRAAEDRDHRDGDDDEHHALEAPLRQPGDGLRGNREPMTVGVELLGELGQGAAVLKNQPQHRAQAEQPRPQAAGRDQRKDERPRHRDPLAEHLPGEMPEG